MAGAVAPALAVSFVKSPVVDGGRAGRITGTEGSSTGAAAILSWFERGGRWTVPRRFACFTFRAAANSTCARRTSPSAGRDPVRGVHGRGVRVIVPPGVEVAVGGIGVMGAFERPASRSP
ncbi:hypothetical protein GCM10010345_55350 [Streptomyces canarius]|uniref:Uncharacterized protein n=1 Tax=Streptomyces canarius TaxID=285453 RepID=A0ABQ3CTV6_9ACTN|nr:hypothetical protein GCM10010345_55350 [Streptomyces canarius]